MDIYKSLITAVKDTLKSQGFSKKGNTFYLFKYGNWGVLNFQKSRDFMPGKTKFTINLGVSSGVITKNLGIGNDDPTIKPEVWECHWKKRIGNLLPIKKDYWWIIDDQTKFEQLKKEIITIINTLAVPDIETHISDQILESLWLSGVSVGITEFERYMYLTIILHSYKRENLHAIIKELKEYAKSKSIEFAANDHIKMIEE